MTSRNVTVAALLGALLVLAAATQTWIHVVPASSSVRLPEIDISGNDAATSVTALSVASLAAAAAATIARTVGRRVIGVILVLAGAGIVAATLSVISNIQSAAATKVGESLGQSVADGTYSQTFWPYLALVGGAVAALAGVAMVVKAGTWAVDRRHTQGTEKAAAAATAQDPSQATAQGKAAASSSSQQQKWDDIDSWDQLSRGDDPTAT